MKKLRSLSRGRPLRAVSSASEYSVDSKGQGLEELLQGVMPDQQALDAIDARGRQHVEGNAFAAQIKKGGNQRARTRSRVNLEPILPITDLLSTSLDLSGSTPSIHRSTRSARAMGGGTRNPHESCRHQSAKRVLLAPTSPITSRSRSCQSRCLDYHPSRRIIFLSCCISQHTIIAQCTYCISRGRAASHARRL